jgi:hypothetical protein
LAGWSNGAGPCEGAIGVTAVISRQVEFCDDIGLGIFLMVPVERIELPTFGLQNRCSTAELNRQLIDARNPFIASAAAGSRWGRAPSNIRVVRRGLLARTWLRARNLPREAAFSARCRTEPPAFARWSPTAGAVPGPWRQYRRPARSRPCRRYIRIWEMRRQPPAGDFPSPRPVEVRAPALPVSGRQRNRCRKAPSIGLGLTAPAASGTPPAADPVDFPLEPTGSAWGCRSIQWSCMIRTHAAGQRSWPQSGTSRLPRNLSPGRKPPPADS